MHQSEFVQAVQPRMSVPQMRFCLRDSIPEIFEAAALLKRAVDHHLTGERTEASVFFKTADMKVVWEWSDSIWGKRDPNIHTIRHVENAPPYLPPAERRKARMPTAAEKKALIDHWGYRCAFCGIPLIHARIRERAVRQYPEAVQWGGKTTLQHAAFMAMWMQFDHIIPHARGGTNDFDNMLVTCAGCNFGRMNYTLDEMGLVDPRTRPVTRTDWDGLEQFK